jgi:flagellar hook-length control protein FliK
MDDLLHGLAALSDRISRPRPTSPETGQEAAFMAAFTSPDQGVEKLSMEQAVDLGGHVMTTPPIAPKAMLISPMPVSADDKVADLLPEMAGMTGGADIVLTMPMGDGPALRLRSLDTADPLSQPDIAIVPPETMPIARKRGWEDGRPPAVDLAPLAAGAPYPTDLTPKAPDRLGLVPDPSAGDTPPPLEVLPEQQAAKKAAPVALPAAAPPKGEWTIAQSLAQPIAQQLFAPGMAAALATPKALPKDAAVALDLIKEVRPRPVATEAMLMRIPDISAPAQVTMMPQPVLLPLSSSPVPMPAQATWPTPSVPIPMQTQSALTPPHATPASGALSSPNNLAARLEPLPLAVAATLPIVTLPVAATAAAPVELPATPVQPPLQAAPPAQLSSDQPRPAPAMTQAGPVPPQKVFGAVAALPRPAAPDPVITPSGAVAVSLSVATQVIGASVMPLAMGENGPAQVVDHLPKPALAPMPMPSLPDMPVAPTQAPPAPVAMPMGDPGELAMGFGLGLADAAATPVAARFGPITADLPSLAQSASQQIAIGAAQLSAEPGGAVDIALDPPELGRVRLSLVEVAGTMTLSITAERPETADLMRRNLALLADAFARQGLDAPSVDISGGGQGGRHPREEGARLPFDAQDQQSLRPTGPSAEKAAPMAAGGLDLRL